MQLRSRQLTALPPKYEQTPEMKLKATAAPAPPPFQTRNALARLIGSSNSSRERLALATAIRDATLIPDKCYLPGWIQNPMVLNKDSASATSVVLAQAQPHVDAKQRGVSLKIAFGEVDTSPDNSLSVERSLYDIYFDYIMRNHFTPNIVTYVASFECSTAQLKNAITHGPQLAKLYDRKQLLNPMRIKWQIEDQEYYDWDKVHVLVLERTQGNTLRKYSKKEHTTDEWRNVFFQIIYTFEVFNRLGLRHNDAHDKNIFIDELNNADVAAFYAIDNEHIFRVPLQHFVKIFDLDMGSSHCDSNYINAVYQPLIEETRRRGICANNTRLTGEMCTDYGLCNDVNQKYDIFLTLGWIYGRPMGKTLPLPDEVANFIKENISEELLDESWGFPYHLGSPLNMGNNASVNPENMKTPFEMLQHPFFDPLRVNMEAVKNTCQSVPLYALPLTPQMSADYWEQVIPDVCLRG